jgi:DNA-binding MarR family transcriptional regulator
MAQQAPAYDPATVASELRVVLGRLIRRLRSDGHFPLSYGAVLGRLDRHGPSTVSELAVAERMRPQSMAQTVGELEADGYVERRPDPSDGRKALVTLTPEGRSALDLDRAQREGWLARVISQDFLPEEQEALGHAVALLRRLADS